MSVRLHHGDCLDFLRTLDSGSVDAVVTDPPYGIGVRMGHVTRTNSRSKWDTKHHNTPIAGDDKPFDPSPLLALCVPLILWGANFYSDKLPGGGWLVWDKWRGIEGMKWNRSDAELAYISGKKTVKTFRHLWHGLCRDSEIGQHLHPTQKPVALMEWCLSFLPEGCTVLDPFMGSGTTGVACVNTGRNFIGCEISADYFAIAEKRIAAAEAARSELLIA